MKIRYCYTGEGNKMTAGMTVRQYEALSALLAKVNARRHDGNGNGVRENTNGGKENSSLYTGIDGRAV